MSTRFLLAPSEALARQVLSAEDVLLSVEAEYGSFVAEGRLYTAAHHQPLGSRFAGVHVGGLMRSPCNDAAIPVLYDGVVLVSHVDLDTFGGCIRALDGQGEFVRSSFEGFWDLAEFVDVNGAHKLSESGASEEDIRKLYAFWAWSKANVPRFDRDRVTDITHTVFAAADALRQICGADLSMLEAGDELRANEQALNVATFRRREGQVIVRVAENSRDFCNHLYADPSGVPGSAVASYNRESGAVTISLADPVPGVSCRAILQDLWGPEAGGHDGIAGSPRGQIMGEGALGAAVFALSSALSTPKSIR